MSRRKRKTIPKIQLLAAALADKLPQEERDQLRRERVSAQTVVRMFTPDHVELHCWNGSDKWWNLDMRRRGPDLRAKDARDTSRAAKVLRVEESWRTFTAAIAKPRKRKRRKSKWASRPMASKTERSRQRSRQLPLPRREPALTS